MTLDSVLKINFCQFFLIYHFKEKIFKFRKIQIFERNLTPNYWSVKKFYMRRVDLNIKKQLSVFEFSILSAKIAKS